MKSLYSAATLMAVFLAFSITDIQANQVKRSKSNVSNNKVNSTKGEVCDDGNSNDADCVKANKDYTTDPYVETTERDPASGQATGKRQHKPITVTKEVDKTTPKLYSGKEGSAPPANEPPPPVTADREAGAPSVSEVVVTKHADNTPGGPIKGDTGVGDVKVKK